MLWAHLVLLATTASGPRLPEFRVGEWVEPPARAQAALAGQVTVLWESLLGDGSRQEIPVAALRILNAQAKTSARGRCCGAWALTVGRQRPRNRNYYRNPRIACAAYTSAILRHCGRPGASFSATAQYGQLRRWGGVLVSSRASTRYVRHLQILKPGDFLFFHKGRGRIGHVEIYVGRGLCSGTSSSEGRVAIRRVGNRGFRLMSVVRI